MSKRGYITRYLSLMKRIKARPYSTYEELRDFMEREIEFLQMQDDTLSIGFSKRTLQRDLREIRNLFGIDIVSGLTLSTRKAKRGITSVTLRAKT